MKRVGKKIANTAKKVVKTVVNTVKNVARTVVNAVKQTAKTVRNAVTHTKTYQSVKNRVTSSGFSVVPRSLSSVVKVPFSAL